MRKIPFALGAGVLSVVLVSPAGEVVGSRPINAIFSRDRGVASLQSRDGVCSLVHTGRLDWAISPYAELKAKCGDRFRISAKALAVETNFFRLSTVLRRMDGSWDWGYCPLVFKGPGEKSRTFALPPGTVSMQVRVTGYGAFAGSFSDLRLERLAPLELDDLPESWTLSSEALEVTVARDGGRFSVRDRRTGRLWKPAAATNDQLFNGTAARLLASSATNVVLRLADVADERAYTASFALEGAELAVSLSGVPDEPLRAPALSFPAPLEPTDDDALIAPFSEGFRLPFADRLAGIWNPRMSNAGMSLPFFGVEEMKSGAGWMAIVETPDDAQMSTFNGDANRLLGVTSGWLPSRGKFGSPRRVRFVFLAGGGYVAMARRYRRTAEREGLAVTFREKAKRRPNVEKLLGAANVWYFPAWREPAHADVARELQAAGLRRFLWSSDAPPADVKAIGALDDVLVGRYDCYRDVYYPDLLRACGNAVPPATNEICRNTSAWPDDIIWNDAADPNSLRRAWGVRDKSGRKVYSVAQCTLCQPTRERRNVSLELRHKPFTARFIDVATAIGLEECENPRHPMTRSRSRTAILELLGLLGEEFGLVVGSEQGMGFAVPVCDYFEGMMSPCYGGRMPHGRPGAGRREIFRAGERPAIVTPGELAKVERYVLGEKYRIPLFELVFHDCCCSHWYWYDYSNRPLYLWWKRDLFNALYGTMPMYIFDYRHWKEHRARFQASYRLTSPIARATGFSEMLDHRALTPDRSVQRSRFADGTTVTVNFGERPYALEDGTTLAPHAAEISPLRGVQN